MELDWLQKESGRSVGSKRMLIEAENVEIPIYRQCELLGLSLSSYSYSPAQESSYNLVLMNMMDKQYLRMPFYGVKRMSAWLRREGYAVNPKRVRRLMRLMGLEAVYPKPRRLSSPEKQHKRYPYLLRDLVVEKPDQVWATDITYIRMQKGFGYLVAVMDWYSRFVLSWEMSNTLEPAFCITALQRALLSGSCEIHNSDQGAQYTSADYLEELNKHEIKISMDGKRRFPNNILVERLWRSVKYEEASIHDYQSMLEAKKYLSSYFRLYNYERLHESLNYRTPAEVYAEGKERAA